MSALSDWLSKTLTWFRNTPQSPGALPPAPTKPRQLNYYPPAVQMPKMRTIGKYKNGYPQGAVIHFTEGRQSQSIKDGIRQGIADGYSYMFLDESGMFGQSIPFTDWGYHAGASFFPGLGTNISSKCVGIEIACAGLLKKSDNGQWVSAEFNFVIPDDQVIVGQNEDNAKAGAYQTFTHSQFGALVDFLIWMKTNNPDVFSFDYVVGHDEIAPDRKFDPGWSLGMSMPDFRKFLIKEYQRRIG